MRERLSDIKARTRARDAAGTHPPGHWQATGRGARFVLDSPPATSRLKGWQTIIHRDDPCMSFSSSHAVAEAYAANDETIAMFGRSVAADTAIEAGIVFA